MTKDQQHYMDFKNAEKTTQLGRQPLRDRLTPQAARAALKRRRSAFFNRNSSADASFGSVRRGMMLAHAMAAVTLRFAFVGRSSRTGHAPSAIDAVAQR